MFTAKNLSISSAKSTITLFLVWAAHLKDQLNLTMDDVIISTTNYDIVLGVPLGSLFRSNLHFSAICKKMISSNKDTAKNLSISSAKSTTTLFLVWAAHLKDQLNVTIDDFEISATNYAIVLGVPLESLFMSNVNVTAICKKMISNNKELAGTT